MGNICHYLGCNKTASHVVNTHMELTRGNKVQNIPMDSNLQGIGLVRKVLCQSIRLQRIELFFYGFIFSRILYLRAAFTYTAYTIKTKTKGIYVGSTICRKRNKA